MLGFKLIYYESLLGNSSNTTIVVKQEDGEIITQASSIGHRRRRYIDDKEMVYRLNITGLQEFTNYSVLVMSYNSFNGPYTPIVTVMTNDDGKMILLRVLTTMERNHIFYPPPPLLCPVKQATNLAIYSGSIFVYISLEYAYASIQNSLTSF